MGVRTALDSGAVPAFRTESAAGRSLGGRLGRYLLIAVGVFLVAYIVARVRGSSDDAIDEMRDRATDAVPDDPTQAATETLDRADEVATIPIRESESDDPEPDAESPPETDDDDDDVIDDAETNAEYTDGERSADEIAERAESDVQEEPAEPGEMAVDEDVAEELVDEVDTDSPSETDAESDSTDDEE